MSDDRWSHHWDGADWSVYIETRGSWRNEIRVAVDDGCSGHASLPPAEVDALIAALTKAKAIQEANQ